MKKLLPWICLCFIAPIPYAQEPAEPEEPAIVLPPMFLEVEDLQVEEVEAALPEDEEQLRPEVSIPLPEAEALYLPEEAFDIPYPDQISAPESSGETSSVTYIERIERETPSTIFSDGRIGVGAPYHVLGDLTLYKLGDDPRFRIRFLHDKIDGYGFRPIGSGFYHGVDELEGTFSYDTDSVKFQAEGSIGEFSRGLQDVITDPASNYESVARQEIGGSVDASYLPSDETTLSGGFETRFVNQILSSTDPAISSELSLRPGIGVSRVLGDFEIGGKLDFLFLSYNAESADVSDKTIMEASVVGSYFFPIDLDLFFEAGVVVPFTNQPILPDVSVTFNGGVGTKLRFQSTAGYVSTQPVYADMWDDKPLLSMTDDFAPQSTLIWSADAQIRPIPELYVTAGIGVEWTQNTIDPDADADTTTGLFDFTTKSITTLNTNLTAEWDISSVFSLSGTWRGAFIDRSRFVPVQEIGIDFDAESPTEKFGGYFGTRLGLWPEARLPEIDLGGFYRVSDSVMFELDAVDVLSPVLESGRQGWGEYVKTGFNILLTTKISL